MSPPQQSGASLLSHLVGHQVREQHHVPPVDAHAMVDHCVLDLVDDSCPGSLNAQSFFHLGKAQSNQRQPPQEPPHSYLCCGTSTKQILIYFPQQIAMQLLGEERVNVRVR